MKKLLVLPFLLSSILFSSEINIEKKLRKEKNIKEQIEKERKYFRDQTFYKGKNYDLKSSEVDENAVKSIPDSVNTNDDFDMNSVYD